MKFIDLFAGMGGFHLALKRLGHECVFASELDAELRELYKSNFPESTKVVHGDIRLCGERVPPHDILCAGFPCQPFSKSGYQNGRRDRTRGTLFHEVIAILKQHKPSYVILENVGNFERHNNGQTWKIVRDSLTGLGYDARGTEHLTSGGHGLISPHHLGYPHTRERFFVVASLQQKLPPDPFPARNKKHSTTLDSILQSRSELTKSDREETALTHRQIECIDHWNSLLARLPARLEPPSFPIWGDEIGASYPFEQETPYACRIDELLKHVRSNALGSNPTRQELLALLPSYAQPEQQQFPKWKIEFIRQNRNWFKGIAEYFTQEWLDKLREFPSSLRKLEWNCKGEERDLWKHVLQFRPSGLRVKRFSSSPALVAMTTTQIPILGPKRRFLTRIEGLRLQGFSDSHLLPTSRSSAFAALGNAVHVEVVKAIAGRLLSASSVAEYHHVANS